MDPKLYSILYLKCPRCNKGNLFHSSNPYNLKKLGKMHTHCPVCGQKYTIEPGFYFGASYVSYALAVVIGLLAYGAQAPFDIESTPLTILIVSLCILLFALYNFCLSRAIWLNTFVRFEKKS